jgi:hypothetical protein
MSTAKNNTLKSLDTAKNNTLKSLGFAAIGQHMAIYAIFFLTIKINIFQQ